MQRITGLALLLLAACADEAAPGIELPRALQQAMLNGLTNVKGQLTIFGSGYNKTFKQSTVDGTALNLTYEGVPPGTYTFAVDLTGDFKSATGLALARQIVPNVNVVSGSHNDRTAIAADRALWNFPDDSDHDSDGLSDVREVLAGLDPGSVWTTLFETTLSDPVLQLGGNDYRNIVFATPSKELRLVSQRVPRSLPVLQDAVAIRVDSTVGVSDNCCGSACVSGLPVTAVAANGGFFGYAVGGAVDAQLHLGTVDLSTIADGTSPSATGMGISIVPSSNLYADRYRGTVTALAIPPIIDGLRVIVGAPGGTGSAVWYGRNYAGVSCASSSLAVFSSQVSPLPAAPPLVAQLTACGTSDVVAVRSNGLQVMHGEATRPECSWDAYNVPELKGVVAMTAYMPSFTCYLLVAANSDGVATNTITRIPLDNLPATGGDCPSTCCGANTAGRLEDSQLPDPTAFGLITAVHYGMSAARETSDVVPEPITVLLIGDDEGHIYVSPLLGEFTALTRESWTLLPALPNNDPGPILGFVTDNMRADDANATFFRPLIVATPRGVYRYD
jgi:hypothetical protein